MKIRHMRGHSAFSVIGCRMAVMAFPLAASKFQVGDRVIVVRPGPDRDMTGLIVSVSLRRPHTRYTVEFNRVDRQLYLETDLALAPIPVAA